MRPTSGRLAAAGWRRLAAAAALVVWPVAGGADGPGDPHLTVVPRSAAEVARIAAVLAPPAGFDAPERFEALPAGAATVRVWPGADAFSQPSANLSFAGEMDFKLGNGLFRKLWISAPATTRASDGLGPLYNARACQACHIKDGRGHPPDGEGGAVSILLRLAVPAPDDAAVTALETYLATLDGPQPRQRPDPVYGGQLQDLAVAGHPAEARLAVDWTEQPVMLAGGEVVSLRRPVWSLAEPAFGPPAAGLAVSARIAPQMIGLGLLEAIPAAEIMALADPDDADGDGISGRANLVWSAEFGAPMLGRFGWKAGQPTLRQQSAAAFSGDMGLSTPLFRDPWGDCTAAQDACRAAPHGDGDARGAEVDAAALDLVAHYARNLAVPERRRPDAPEVLQGKAVFHAAGCAACHAPKHVTARLQGQEAQSFQLIWPYTDLLLHDMGPGLADGVTEGRAVGAEWRTPPLWGIGLTAQVGGQAAFLHDGRARSLLEAVLWHGGEAQAARDRVVDLPPADRAALIAFLESL
jgi:CxxC motif-containing protein (DUF1111 family)